MNNQIDPSTVVNLPVSVQVVDLILEGLGELQAKRVLGVIAGIRHTVQQQLNAPKPTEGADATTAPPATAETPVAT